MKLSTPFDNFKLYYQSNPPIALFGICLFMFTVVTMSLGLFVHNADIEDSEVLSWNKVMQKFTGLNLCVYGEEEIQQNAAVTQQAENDQITTLSIAVPVTTGLMALSQAHSVLKGIISSELLGLTVEEIMHSNVTVSFDFGSDTISSPTNRKYACITFEGPIHLLEGLPRSKSCEHPKEEKTAAFHGQADTSVKCVKGYQYKVIFENMPEWMAYLSEEERIRTSIHLLATTAFLFTVLIVLACMACIRGKKAGQAEGYRVV